MLINSYPRLFHMAEPESWDLIQEYGLLSTKATLDRFVGEDELRKSLEERHRSSKTKVEVNENGQSIVLRDQKPMPRDRLALVLNDGITPEEWYSFLNSKVFTWAEEERLNRLLKAREYRKDEHDVLVLDTTALIEKYDRSVLLCHMNSGNTFPYLHKRGWEIFKSVEAYPVSKKTGKPQKKVAEVVFDYSIPDIKDFVLEAKRVKGDQFIKNLDL
ncbi:DUF7002 family protein [Marinobacter confluentis]|uniref:Uncharacterized protein n=1 Tax=Marinobacter confluentis TaxID=1697557 RepID=A0A4Z1C5U8_9GAMM|nr:hypothetical protein E5Q11_08665 [Marinobacter confluentis]